MPASATSHGDATPFDATDIPSSPDLPRLGSSHFAEYLAPRTATDKGKGRANEKGHNQAKNKAKKDAGEPAERVRHWHTDRGSHGRTAEDILYEWIESPDFSNMWNGKHGWNRDTATAVFNRKLRENGIHQSRSKGAIEDKVRMVDCLLIAF